MTYVADFYGFASVIDYRLPSSGIPINPFTAFNKLYEHIIKYNPKTQI